MKAIGIFDFIIGILNFILFLVITLRIDSLKHHGAHFQIDKAVIILWMIPLLLFLFNVIPGIQVLRGNKDRKIATWGIVFFAMDILIISGIGFVLFSFGMWDIATRACCSR